MNRIERTESRQWDEFRVLVPATRKWAYLDNAAVAPLSRPARDAILSWSAGACEDGDTVWPDWARGIESVRTLAASLIHADPDEIAFVANTTAGISLVAEGFPWQAGDNIVVLGNEFPSNLYPWMNLAARGVECRRISLPSVAVEVERILAACDKRTRIISASWVGFTTGWRIDIGELVHGAHQRGILVFIDAIQALGVFPLNVQRIPIDFLAADGHKWLMGPEGAGLFYLRKEHLERLRPLGIGWNSVVHAHDFTKIELKLHPTAVRYEGGSQNMCGLLALGASLRMLAQFGLGPDQSPLADRVLEITDLACERLTRLGAVIHSQRLGAGRSGIVAFDLPGRDLLQEKRRCFEAGIVLSYRGGWLRISPHAYANEQDITRLEEVLRLNSRC